MSESSGRGWSEVLMQGTGTYLHVILVQEKNDSDVVMKSHNVRFREGFHRGHVRLGGLKGPENILRQTD